MKVKVINKSSNPLPEYKTKSAAGMDVKSNLKGTHFLKPMERLLVPTGLLLEIPQGYEAQVRPRSGLALKHGITVLNTPGTIDADYRGEVGIILVNLSNKTFPVNYGERIAQIVFTKCEQVELIEVEQLDNTERGQGGFGSTGK